MKNNIIMSLSFENYQILISYSCACRMQMQCLAMIYADYNVQGTVIRNMYLLIMIDFINYWGQIFYYWGS